MLYPAINNRIAGFYFNEETMTRLMINLTEQESEALQNLAKDKMRGIKDQAHLILRKELEQNGLLVTNQPSQLFMDKQEDKFKYQTGNQRDKT
jgi:hypothetical protein